MATAISQSPAYFGGCLSNGDIIANNGYDFFSSTYWHNNTATIEYTCPGTGPRTVSKLGCYALAAGGTPGNLRIAIYSNDLSTLICQGDSSILVTGSVAWRDHTAFSGGTTLIGGTKYVIVVTADSSDVRISYSILTNGTKVAYGTNYVSGFPASISAGGSNGNSQVNTRCYVI